MFVFPFPRLTWYICFWKCREQSNESLYLFFSYFDYGSHFEKFYSWVKEKGSGGGCPKMLQSKSSAFFFLYLYMCITWSYTVGGKVRKVAGGGGGREWRIEAGGKSAVFSCHFIWYLQHQNNKALGKMLNTDRKSNWQSLVTITFFILKIYWLLLF